MRLAVLTSLLVTVAATAAADGPVGRIVYGGITDEGMSVYIVNADGRRHAQLAKHGANPRWLPDGSGVIVGPRLVDPDTGASTEFPTDHGVSDVSPDGQWYATLGSGLAAGVATREVATYRADGSEYRVLTELDLGQLNSLEWAPDGRSLLVAARIGGGNRIYVIDAEDGAAVAMLPDGEEGYDAHWSADGGSIYYIGDRGGLRRVDVVDRSMHVIDRWFAGHLFAVSPDGKYLLSESPWEGQADLAAFDLSGVFVSRITDHEALPRRADWFIPRHLLPVSPVRTRAMTWGMLRDGVE